MKPDAGRSLIWALVESGGLSLLSLLVLFVVARLIGPAELGVVSLALGIVQVLAVVTETSLHDAIVQRRDLEDDHLHTAFWTCIGMSLVFVGGCWLVAPLLAQAFDSPQLTDLLRVVAFGLAMTGVGSVPIAVLRRHFLFKQLAIRSLYGRLAGAVVGITLALMGYGMWSLIVQYILQAAVNCVLVWPACPWRPAWRFSFRRLRELFSYGALSVGSRIVWISSVRLFTMLVGYFLGVAAIGYLNIAQRVVDTLYDLLAGAAYNLALPFFSRRQDDKALFNRAFYTTNEFAALSVPPIFAGLAVCAAPVVLLILGDTWLPAVPLIQVMAVAALVQFILIFPNAAVMARGRPGVIFILSLVGFVFAIGTLLLVRPPDALGATWIWVARIAVTAPFLVLVAWRILGFSAMTLMRSVFFPLTATVVMAGGVAWAWHAYLTAWLPLHALFVMVPLGVGIYLGMLLVTSRQALRRLYDFVLSGLRGAKPS